MRNTKNAFTLVELIVVITILAILGTIAFISLQGYSAEARNSKRTSDLGNIQSAMSLKAVEGVPLLSFVTLDQVNTVGSASATDIDLGGAVTITANTSYNAGKPAYSVLNITAKDFKDPNDNEYVVASTSLRGGVYQLAATIEVDSIPTALIKGTYTPRLASATGSFTALGAGTIGTTGKGIITIDSVNANFFKKGDTIDITGGTVNQSDLVISKVSKDGLKLTFDSKTFSEDSNVIALANDESASLIGATVGTAGNPVTDNGITDLPY